MRKILSFLVLLLFAVTMSAETWKAGEEIAAADLKAGDVILLKNANTANADAMWFGGYHIVKNRTYESGCANYSLGMFPYIKNRSAFELVAGPTMNGQASFYFKEVTTGEYIRCTFESSSYVDLTNDVSAATSFIPTAKSSGSYLVSYNGADAWSLKPFHSYGEMYFGTGGSDMAGFKFYKAEQTSTSFLRSDQVANTEVEDGMELLFQVPYCYYGNSRYGERFAGSQYLDNTQISTNAHKWIATVFSDIPALATSYGYNEDNVWVLEYASPATTTGYSDFYYLKSKSTGKYLFRNADTQVQSSSTTTDKTKATAFTFAPKSAASYGYYSRGDYSNDKTVSLLTDDADYKYFGSGHGYGFAIYSNEKFANWNIYKIVAATPENLQAIAYSELQELIATLEAKRLIGGTTAGYCTEATYAPYETALNAAKALSATDDRSDILSALYDLQEAYEALETVPISEGYYYIISDNQLIAANGKSEKALYTNTSTGTLYWGELDEGDKKFVFKFTGNLDGTWNLQNLDNDKYIGAPKVNSSNNSQFCQEFENTDTSTYPATFIFDGEGSYRIKVDNWTLCPQGNANGKNAGPTYVWAYNAEGIHGEASYTLRKTSLLEILTKSALTSLSTITPKNHHDNTGTRSFLLGNERTSVDGLATSTEHLAELQAAYDDAVAALAEGKDENDVPEVYAALVAAKAKVDAKSNPLVDGYYHLIAEFDGGTDGIPGGFVIEADGDGIKKIAYNANEPKQMFKVEYDAANGKVYLQNVANEKYLGVVDGSAWKFSAERIALNVMTGNNHNWYWSADRTVAARSCSFILSDAAGKGISSANCGVRNDVTNTSTEAWLESWAFRPADEYYADYIANGPLKTAIENLADTYANLEYGTNPGEYAQAGVEAFQNLYASDVTAYNGGNNTLTIAEQQAMADALSAAYQTAINTRVPLTDGYYVIKSAASAFGANEYAMYIDNNGKVAWKAYDAAAPGEFIFQLTDQNATVTPDGVTYEVFSYYNIAQKKYIGQCSTQMVYEDASTSDEVWGACAQVLTPAGQFAIQPMWNPTTVSFCLTVDNTSNTSGIVRTSGWYGGYSGGNNNGSWKFEKVDLEAVTIGATGYSTYVSDKALVIPEGVTANGVTGLDGSDIELTQLSGNVLAADEPVILQGEAGKKFYFIVTDEIGNSIAGNLLEGTGTEGKSIGANEAYVLYNNQGTAVFRIAGAMTLPAHKAYLPAGVVNGAGAKEFGLGGLTGINNAQTSNLESQTYFDLQGRKVAAPQKGQLYIINGKKVLY